MGALIAAVLRLCTTYLPITTLWTQQYTGTVLGESYHTIQFYDMSSIFLVCFSQQYFSDVIFFCVWLHLGHEQEVWLEEQLVDSRAAVHVLVSSVQVCHAIPKIILRNLFYSFILFYSTLPFDFRYRAVRLYRCLLQILS